MPPTFHFVVPLLALLMATGPPAAMAQQPPADVNARPEAPVDISRIPIDLNRIHRELQQTTFREQQEGLNLRVTVDVIAQAPPLQMFQFTREDNLLTGPVPDSAPTHRELVDHVTPREYRAPIADFSALIRWLAEKAKSQ